MMLKSLTILCFLALSAFCSIGQKTQILDSLLLPLYNIGNSKFLSEQPTAKSIISYGPKMLSSLVSYFADTTLTNIKSDCQDSYLKKGEVAIIIADRIEMMPYAQLTGFQNCLMEFCKDNPNWIEYYFPEVRKMGMTVFTEKYQKWLTDHHRILKANWKKKIKSL